MDILVSSSFGRLLWYLALENVEGVGGEEGKYEAASKTVDGWMSRVKIDRRVEVPVGVLESAREDFLTEKISDELELGFLFIVLCSMPIRYSPPKTYRIILSTAKFSEAVTKALEQSVDFNFEQGMLPEEFIGLLEKESVKSFAPISNLANLRRLPDDSF